MWFKRMKVGLYYAFLWGADPVHMENGPFYLFDRSTTWSKDGGVDRKTYGPEAEETKQAIAVLHDFSEFCENHPRPGNGPKVTLGIVHGNLDGYAGLWNRNVWGQDGEEWKGGPPEYGVDFVETLYRRENWYSNTLEGEHDFSGNPPYGQHDYVPIEAPLDVLKTYTALVFLGWNTMTPEIYEKLKQYVEDGGHLVMAVPHLSTQIRRNEDLSLINNGDVGDLFGVRIKGRGLDLTVGHRFVSDSSLENYRFPVWGICDPKFINGEYPLADIEVTTATVLCRSSANYYEQEQTQCAPVLTENTLGKGKAFLITSWCYPGERGMALFMRELIRDIAIGEQGNIRLAGSDRVRYAVFEEDGMNTIYLLNTDFEVTQHATLWLDGETIPDLAVPSTELRIAYWSEGLCVVPQDSSAHVESIRRKEDRYAVKLAGTGPCRLAVYRFTGAVSGATLDGVKLPVEMRDDAVMIELVSEAEDATLSLT